MTRLGFFGSCVGPQTHTQRFQGSFNPDLEIQQQQQQQQSVTPSALLTLLVHLQALVDCRLPCLCGTGQRAIEQKSKCAAAAKRETETEREMVGTYLLGVGR
jgi:hypothetical protein